MLRKAQPPTLLSSLHKPWFTRPNSKGSKRWIQQKSFHEDAGSGILTARIAKNNGISLRATFSAAARGPEVLVLWLGHSSIASISKPALRSVFTYDSIGLWKVHVYCTVAPP